MFKVNRKTGKRCEICSKLTLKTPERRQWRHSGVFIVDFEHISHLVPEFLFLTLHINCRLGDIFLSSKIIAFRTCLIQGKAFHRSFTHINILVAVIYFFIIKKHCLTFYRGFDLQKSLSKNIHKCVETSYYVHCLQLST